MGESENGGTPQVKANGNYRNGFYMQQARQDRQMVRDLIRFVREMGVRRVG